MRFNNLLSRRKEKEPIAYILGYKYFWKYKFKINKSVLMPRPDTELVIEESLRCLPYNASKKIVHKRLGNNPSKHSKLLYFKEMYQNFLNFEEILNYEYLYWESFINFADISDKDLKFLKDKKDKEDIFILCTNQNTNIQLLKISSWNLDMFNFVITSEEVGYEKPNRNFFQYVVKIIKDFDRNKYNFFAVGDDYENDIKFWKNNYEARSYLIDNSNKRFDEKNNIINTNFQMALEDIFRENSDKDL